MGWVTGNARNKNAAYRAVAEYMHDHSALQNGVYLSTDQAGVLLVHNVRQKPPIVAALILKIKLLRSVGLRRSISVMKRNRYIRAHHPSDRKFLHVPYFGVEPGERGRGAAIELKNMLFRQSEEMGIPIYLETTQEQNKRVYERYGFRVFHEFVFRNSGFTTWMLKRASD